MGGPRRPVRLVLSIVSVVCLALSAYACAGCVMASSMSVASESYPRSAVYLWGYSCIALLLAGVVSVAYLVRTDADQVKPTSETERSRGARTR